MLEDEGILNDPICWMISTVRNWVCRVVERLMNARGGKSVTEKKEVPATKYYLLYSSLRSSFHQRLLRQCLWAILCLRGTSSAFAFTMMTPRGTYLAFGRPSNTSIILSGSLWSLVQSNDAGPSPVDDASLVCVLPF